MEAESLLLLGPPGTGKTYYLIEQIEQALSRGVRPWGIGFTSYSRKSITEAKERICRKFNANDKDFPNARTLHSWGFRGLGLTAVDVMSKSDYAMIGSHLGVDFSGADQINPEDGILLPALDSTGSRCVFHIDRARYRKVSLEQEFSEAGDYDLSFAKMEQIRRTIESYKSRFKKFDFVDMIEMYIKHGERPQLDLFIVDEAQDLTPLQWDMARHIAGNAERTIYAGDDDQCIHTWTGADVNEFFKASYTTKVLSQSYRLPRAVHAEASRISRRISRRMEKEFLPRDADGEVAYHMTIHTVPFDKGSITFMARVNAYVAEMAEWLRSQGYLYSWKGKSSLSHKTTQAMRAWQTLRDGGSISLPEIKVLYEELPKSGDKQALRRGSSKLLEALDPLGMYDYEALAAYAGLKAEKDQDPMVVLDLPWGVQVYIEALLRRGEDIYSPPRIKLSTIHSMKGGEDDICVIYLGSTRKCVEGNHPDDEHRVWYTGFTRARHTLHIVHTDKSYGYEP